MRHRVRNIAHAVDQLLDLPQHAVDDPRQLVELVGGIGGRHAARQIALDNRLCRIVDRLDPHQQRPPRQAAAQHRHRDGRRNCPA